MKKRKCENTGLELSVLGTGCWAFGGGEYWGKQCQKDVNDVVRASIDFGINYFDTAEVYNEGRSEISLGKAISGIPRDNFLIGTKVSPSNCYKNKIIIHCEESLKRMNIDYVDIYMIHWPIHPHSIKHFTSDIKIIQNPPTTEEAIGDLIKLKEQGKIRYFGVSNFSLNRLKELPTELLTVNELPYNLLCRAIEFDTLNFCKKQGIGVIGYMALMQGILTDLYPTLSDIPSWQKRTRHFSSKISTKCRHDEDGIEEDIYSSLRDIRLISSKTGIKICDLAIKWILANPAVTCTLIGSRNIAQLKENIEAAEGDLNENVKKELNKVTSEVMRKLGNHFDYYESAVNDRTL